MKFVKIYFAVVFFCFLTGSNLNLVAQSQSTLSFGQSSTIPVAGLVNDILYSKNGKYTFFSKENSLIIYNLQSTKYKEIFELQKGYKMTRIRVTEGTVILTSIPDPNGINANDPTKHDAIWGDKSKGGKYTKLVMEDDGSLVLYNGTAQGENGDVIWKVETQLENR